MYRKLILLLSIALLSACTGTSQQGLDKMQTMMTNRPEIKTEAISLCIEDVTLSPRSHREGLARLMRVSLAKVPSTFCRRVIGALAAGRLSQADLESVNRGSPSQNILRVVKG